MTRVRFKLLGLLCSACTIAAHADSAPFDLAGPNLEITVTRGQTTLPISEVPNLAPGDQLWIKAEFPASQSAQYLLVAAFLTGSTNPPPASWFFRCETWTRSCSQEGLTLTVPQDAQQALVFLAPKTRGDFGTLVDAVRGRPGAFVRTSQDLNQASLDRSRLQAYLAAIRAMNDTDQAQIKEATSLLARSLAIKVNDKCLDRMPELQAPCLMQGGESLILDDGHSTSMVEELTAGPASDLAMQASYTPQLGYGYYSPYIAAVFDIGRILASLRTAQYQYIPALATLTGEQLALTLNTPPSFHDPKSVIVVALPAVEHAQLPPLHAVNPKDIYCARKSTLVLPVEGAPLVFSTAFTHELTLSLAGKNSAGVDLPVRADALLGGFVVDTSALKGVSLGESVHASLHGYWGFEAYDGPQFQLENSHPQTWQLSAGDEQALIVGRQDTIHLTADSVSCLDNVLLRDAAGKELKPEWKAVKADEVELKLPLQSAQPGSLTLLMKQYGNNEPQPVQLQAFAEPGHLDDFNIYAGDAQGILKGSRLDAVAKLLIKGIEFVPGTLSSHQGTDELPMIAKDAQAAAALKPADALKVKVTLNDGRVLSLTAHVGPPRPRVTLIDKSVQPSSSSGASHIHIDDSNELPQDARLTFSVLAQSPTVFAHDETIEVATANGSSSTVLSFANGALTLANSHMAVATLDAAHPLGMSAFGPLQFRVNLNGVSSDWQPLATLVRLPVLTNLTCPATPELACKLSGSGLFLLDSISSDPQFTHPVQVPDGFPGYALAVPHSANGQLYVKLRDDPSVANPVAMSVVSLPPSAKEAARAAARLAAAASVDRPAAEAAGTASPSADSNPSSAIAQIPAEQRAASPPAQPVAAAASDELTPGSPASSLAVSPSVSSTGQDTTAPARQVQSLAPVPSPPVVSNAVHSVVAHSD